jgi:chemotaxis methyl-accepting protein methylase/chemotaxis response regulator CheB
MLSGLLGRHTKMPVVEAHDDTHLEAGRVYTIAPGTRLGMSEGVLQVSRAEPLQRARPVDAFLRDLAKSQGERSIGIVLSGCGTDGTSGLRAIKQHGGLTLVQTPETAKYDGMPRSAIAAGLADLVLPVEQMPAQLIEHSRAAEEQPLRDLTLQERPTKEAHGSQQPPAPFVGLGASAGGLEFLEQFLAHVPDNSGLVDGAAGLRAIKERGGLAFAQAPVTARHDSMPLSAIESGVVDQVLTPEHLAANVLEHAANVANAESAATAPLEPASNLGRICSLIRRHTGHDFAGYKAGTLARRIHRRLQVLQVPSVEDYLPLLERDASEAHALVKSLLIVVTEFFRDPKAFHALEQQVIPRIVHSRPGEALRIWVVGCASGEEAYSVAILVREHLERLGTRRVVQVLATDLEAEMLAGAQQGRYPLSIAEHVGSERLARFFERQGDSYQVSRELQEMCIFSEHNVIRDSPFSDLDLISCRNLLIYFSARLQRRVVPLFHNALRPGGFLLLGPSEWAPAPSALFETIDKRYRIYRRKETAARPGVGAPADGVER